MRLREAVAGIFLCGAITVCTWMSLSGISSFAQVSNTKSKALPSFVAASVKPFNFSSPTSPPRLGYPRVHLPGIALVGVIQFAFGTETTHITGIPHWAIYTHYGIDASVPASVGKLPPKQRKQAISLMMRSLLIHRFGLKYHETTRKGHVYWLTVEGAKPKFLLPGGPTAQPSWQGSD